MNVLRIFRHGRDAVAEATASRIRAEANLQAIRAETPKYRALGEALRAIREHNHLGESIEASFRGGRP